VPKIEFIRAFRRGLRTWCRHAAGRFRRCHLIAFLQNASVLDGII
jgi:hypothetical protein